jgi:microcystin-dependent protein
MLRKVAYLNLLPACALKFRPAVVGCTVLFGFYAALGGVHAQTTGITGSNQPFINYQPSLAVTEVVDTTGTFPIGNTPSGDSLGFIYNIASPFIPGNNTTANGQLLPINTNQGLFALYGTTFGGNGLTNFALPNLSGRVAIGEGSGPGLSPQTLGVPTGSQTVTLTTAQLPAHDHTLSGGGVTGTTGGNQPFSNMQPSLPLTPLIATQTSAAPPPGSVNANAVFLGEIGNFAGNVVPTGWAVANGQLLSIASNTDLFFMLGTTYGGDGMTTFGVPDLRGRAVVGATGINPISTVFGQEQTTLTTVQMPAHDHTVPGGGVTGVTGGSLPVTNQQPSIAMNYLIATIGALPGRGSPPGFNPTVPTIGEIAAYAGFTVPNGWMIAEGQILPISQFEDLFNFIGTTYGGDGVTTFGVPDLRGRTLIGTGFGFSLADLIGTDANTLSVANLPAHDHSLPQTLPGTPLPGALPLFATGLGVLGLLSWRRRRKTAA